MKLSVFSTTVAATILLGVLAASASAGRLSLSSQSISANWTRLNISGGFGTVECEVALAGTLQTRTIAKTSGSLVGYITAANVPRCSRGGATLLRETLPWHLTYSSFSGTLPNITRTALNLHGFAFRIREPTFGVTALGRSTLSAVLVVFLIWGANQLTSILNNGTIGCIGIVVWNCTVNGTSSSVSANTITLI